MNEEGEELSTSKAAEDDQRVGYRRPPVRTRFGPGQSGNPRGRPKGARNLSTVVAAALGVNQGLRAGAVDMQFAVVRLLKAIGLQVLVIDEVHNILAGTARDQRIVLNALRYLSNELGAVLS